MVQHIIPGRSIWKLSNRQVGDQPGAKTPTHKSAATSLAPNQAWAADISYVRTWEGWLYLTVVLDLFSRRVVGWSIGDHMRTGLVLGALHLALELRQPGTEPLHPSDRGSQYASRESREQLAERRVRCSMSRRGNCLDSENRASRSGAQPNSC
ncbi:MAG: DDE-type integrase/transposase/recombinase [Deltaproteobacteria bacterium]|nr:DDE-type integrase/transposase/recombinase [Deltaproteobacteria bacterium]